MILNLLREGLGRVLLVADFLTRPRPVERPAAEQSAVTAATRGMALYHSRTCPYCIKTRRVVRHLNLPIALRDTKQDPTHAATLLAEGGKLQVPCLRFAESDETCYLYESAEIVAYLKRRFGAGAAGPSR